MAVWAEFYRDDGKGNLCKVCGTDGTARIDARFEPWWQAELARREGKRRGFDGFSLIKGDSLRTAVTVRRPGRIEPLPAHTEPAGVVK